MCMDDDEFKKLVLERFDTLDARLYRIERRLINVEGRLTLDPPPGFRVTIS
jgi:hypothetical protein